MATKRPRETRPGAVRGLRLAGGHIRRGHPQEPAGPEPGAVEANGRSGRLAR